MTVEDLKSFGLLAEFADEDREALFELLEPMTIRQGRSVYRETAEAEGLVLIVSGTVRLSSRRCDDLGALTDGAVLGGASLFGLGSREATAKAETETKVLMLARTAYRRLVEDHPRTACRLAEAIGGELAGLLREGLDVFVPRSSADG